MTEQETPAALVERKMFLARMRAKAALVERRMFARYVQVTPADLSRLCDGYERANTAERERDDAHGQYQRTQWLLEQRNMELAKARAALIAYDPPLPLMLEDETPEQYTNRLTGADKTGRVPYAEHRNRQCSIGYHDECSDPSGRDCKCPCHQFERLRQEALGQVPS